MASVLQGKIFTPHFVSLEVAKSLRVVGSVDRRKGAIIGPQAHRRTTQNVLWVFH